MAAATRATARRSRPATIAAGSSVAATSGTAVDNAAQGAIAALAELAVTDRASPLYGAGNAGVTAADGRLARRDDPARSESFGEILARAEQPGAPPLMPRGGLKRRR